MNETAKTLQASSLFGHLEHHAERAPGAPAIHSAEGAPCTYGALRDFVLGLAGLLRARGVGPGDRVAVVTSDGPEAVAAILGTACCAACVPVNPGYSPVELRNVLTWTRARTVLAGDREYQACNALCGELDLACLPIPEVGAARGGGARPDGFAWPGEKDTAIVYHTSGTTARPKIVPITHGQICSALPHLIRHLRMTPDDCGYNLLPVFWAFSASAAVFATIASGSSIFVQPAFSPESCLRELLELKATRLLAGPAQLDALAEHVRRSPRDPAPYALRFVQTGGSPMNPDTVRTLEACFHAPILAGWGMSEAAVTVTLQPLPPERRNPGSVGKVMHGEVRIVDRRGDPLPAGAEGEVVMRGPALFSGYEGEAGPEEGGFRDGWFRTGDLGFFDPDGQLFISGRIKEFINRGGQKVSPTEVEEAVRRLPEVDEAACFPVPHRRLGEDVAVAIVLKPGADPGYGDIRRALSARLAAYKLPARILFVDAIPRSDVGKIRRSSLFADLARGNSEAFRPGRRVAPRDPVEAALASIWAGMLDVPEVGVTEDFFNLGGDSLMALELMESIESIWGKQLPASVLLEHGTIEKLGGLISGESVPMPDIVPFRPYGARTSLFCMHARHGDVMQYLGLTRYLDPEVPVYALRFTTPEGGPGGRLTVPALARRYLELVRGIQPAGPYCLAGHSFGGMLAYEMAGQLLEMGEEIQLLAMFDAGTPRLDFLRPRPGRRKGRWAEFKHVPVQAWGPHLWEKARREYRRLRRRFGILQGATERIQWAADHYVPPEYPVDVVLFRAAEEMEGMPSGFDPRLGWEKYAKGGVRIFEVPGDHGSHLQEPHVQTVALKLNELLRDSGGGAPALG